jgi:phosphoribosylcarboxyaminoimidazole (NCAIR) mutase
MLALSDPDLVDQLSQFKARMAQEVASKDKTIQEAF